MTRPESALGARAGVNLSGINPASSE